MAGMDEYWGHFCGNLFVAGVAWAVVAYYVINRGYYDQSRGWKPASAEPGMYRIYVGNFLAMALFASALFCYGVITGTFPQQIWRL